MDLSQLRALQDWFLKYELKSVPNAEVASVGGMVSSIRSCLTRTAARVQRDTPESHRGSTKGESRNRRLGPRIGRGGVHGSCVGYLESLDDFRKVPLLTTNTGVAVTLGDIARVQVGPELRRGIAELNGEGEVAGGVIIMRSGKNALETINAVKAKLAALRIEPSAGRRDRAHLRSINSSSEPSTTCKENSSKSSSSWHWSAKSSSSICAPRLSLLSRCL